MGRPIDFIVVFLPSLFPHFGARLVAFAVPVPVTILHFHLRVVNSCRFRRNAFRIPALTDPVSPEA